MPLISKFNKELVFYNVLLIFLVNMDGLLKLLMLFKKRLNESGPKPNKIWVGKGSGFYNRLMKS